MAPRGVFPPWRALPQNHRPATGASAPHDRFDHPPGPLPGQEGGDKAAYGGHPRAPGKGASPLCTPHAAHEPGFGARLPGPATADDGNLRGLATSPVSSALASMAGSAHWRRGRLSTAGVACVRHTSQGGTDRKGPLEGPGGGFEAKPLGSNRCCRSRPRPGVPGEREDARLHAQTRRGAGAIDTRRDPSTARAQAVAVRRRTAPCTARCFIQEGNDQSHNY